MARCHLRFVAVALVCTLAASSTRGQDAPAELVVRVYDVADLVTVQDASGIVPPMSLANICWPPPTSAPARTKGHEARDGLTIAIQAIVDETSWRINGGTQGTLYYTPAKTGLLIQQTEANHAKIRQLLTQLRQEQSATPMVRVRVEWVVLDPSDVATAAAHPELVKDEAVFARAKPYATAEATGFAGRAIEWTNQRERSVMTSIAPVVGAQAVTYVPTVEPRRTGVTLRITPKLGEGSAVIDLRSRVGEAHVPVEKIAPTTQPAIDSTAAILKMIDQSEVLTQDIAVTTRVPLGRRVAVAGMTLDPAAGESAARQLVVLVRVDAVP